MNQQLAQTVKGRSVQAIKLQCRSLEYHELRDEIENQHTASEMLDTSRDSSVDVSNPSDRTGAGTNHQASLDLFSPELTEAGITDLILPDLFSPEGAISEGGRDTTRSGTTSSQLTLLDAREKDRTMLSLSDNDWDILQDDIQFAVHSSDVIKGLIEYET